MTPSLRTRLALALMGLMAVPLAHADLVIDADKKPASKPAPVVVKPAAEPVIVKSTPSPSNFVVTETAQAPSIAYGGTVTEVGKPVVNPTKLDGWADDVPVSVALRQVVPAGWTIRSSDLDQSVKVSWSGGRPWPEVLRELAKRGCFNAAIGWSDKVVSITKPGVPASLALAQPIAQPVKAVPVAPPVQTWKMLSSRTLRENIEAWAKQAGWNKVVWEGADYDIPGSFDLTGQFTAPDGPVARAIEAFENSRTPLRVKMSTLDKVIYVSNKNYQPTEVQPLSAQEIAPASFNNDNQAGDVPETPVPGLSHNAPSSADPQPLSGPSVMDVPASRRHK